MVSIPSDAKDLSRTSAGNANEVRARSTMSRLLCRAGTAGSRFSVDLWCRWRRQGRRGSIRGGGRLSSCRF